MKEFLSNALIWITLICNILIILFLMYIFYRKIFNKKVQFFDKGINIIKSNYLIFGFIIALAATLGSLFYSEIIGYPPCNLCWYQRILIYPQVLLFAIAIINKDLKVRNYIIALTILGLIITGYQYYIQSSEGSTCIVNSDVPCTEKYLLSFGYITIPMMSLTAFALLLIISILAGKNHKNKP